METVTLDYPITVNGATFASVAMRRPKVSDELAAKKLTSDDAMYEVTLIANLTELAPEDILKMDSADFRKLLKVFTSFFA